MSAQLALAPAPRVPLTGAGLDGPELVHDVRKELAVVQHLVDALLCSVPARPDLSRLLTALADEIAVVDDLLLSAAGSAAWEQVDLVELARQVVASAQVVHRGPVELRAEPVPLVSAPSVLLRRALANLVVNACEAAPAGRVQVVVAAEDGAVTVDVEDEGLSGEPWEDCLGLGLWIVHAVVRDCGGVVERDRSALGGRRVRVRLAPAVPDGA